MMRHCCAPACNAGKSHPPFFPPFYLHKLVPNLALSARGDEVSLSIIDGKIVTVDEAECIAYAQQTAEEICAKSSTQKSANAGRHSSG